MTVVYTLLEKIPCIQDEMSLPWQVQPCPPRGPENPSRSLMSVGPESKRPRVAGPPYA